jgi:glycerol uptake facilitator-like aquaporin
VQRLTAEVVGTAVFVLFLVGAIIATGGDAFVAAITVLFVNAVAAWIFGGHFNPWLTLATAIRGGLDWTGALAIIAAQLAGAIIGALLIWAVLGTKAVNAGMGVTHLPPSANVLVAGLAEALAVFVACCALFALADNANLGGIGVGMALAAGVLLIAPVSGASINFARSFGPEVVNLFAAPAADWTGFAGLWVYLVSGIVGAALAALAYPLWRPGAPPTQIVPGRQRSRTTVTG